MSSISAFPYQGLPSGIPVTDSHFLKLGVRSSKSVTLRVLGLNVQPDGTIGAPIDFILTTTGDRTTADSAFKQLTPGYLVYATVQISIGTAQRGQVYVGLSLSNSQPGAASARLIENYVRTGRVLSWPWGNHQDPVDGPGYVYTISTADPAAGSEVAAQAVPTGGRWKVLAYSVQLAQGITQTPLPTLRIRSGATTIAAQIPITQTAIAASSTSQLTWAKGAVQNSFTAVVGDEVHIAPIPDMFLNAGDDIGTVTDGIGANTNYGAALITVEEWLDVIT